MLGEPVELQWTNQCETLWTGVLARQSQGDWLVKLVNHIANRWMDLCGQPAGVVLASGAGTDVWMMPWTRAVAGIMILCILIAVSFYVVSSYRDYTGKDRREPFFAASNLEEMLRRGDISEAEFRTIHSKSHGVSIASARSGLLPVRDRPQNTGDDHPGGASHVDKANRSNDFLPPMVSDSKPLDAVDQPAG